MCRITQRKYKKIGKLSIVARKYENRNDEENTAKTSLEANKEI